METYADNANKGQKTSSQQVRQDGSSISQFIDNRGLEATPVRPFQPTRNKSDNIQRKALTAISDMAGKSQLTQTRIAPPTIANTYASPKYTAIPGDVIYSQPLQRQSSGVVQMRWKTEEPDKGETRVWIDDQSGTETTYTKVTDSPPLYFNATTQTIQKWNGGGFVQSTGAESETAQHNILAMQIGKSGKDDVNCYSWAWARSAGSGAKTAGSFSGSGAATVHDRALADGMISLGRNLAGVVARANANNIIAARFSGASEHWWRRHGDGTWSEASDVQNPSPLIQKTGAPVDDQFVINAMENDTVPPAEKVIRMWANGFEGYYLVPITAGPNQNDGGNCFLTTACVEMMGLPDNCEELTVLRAFRDQFLLNQPNGQNLFALYYHYSPLILAAIKRDEEEEEWLKTMYKTIGECVAAVKNGDNLHAYHTYCNEMVRLAERFIPDYVPEIRSLMGGDI